MVKGVAVLAHSDPTRWCCFFLACFASHSISFNCILAFFSKRSEWSHILGDPSSEDGRNVSLGMSEAQGPRASQARNDPGDVMFFCSARPLHWLSLVLAYILGQSFQ